MNAPATPDTGDTAASAVTPSDPGFQPQPPVLADVVEPGDATALAAAAEADSAAIAVATAAAATAAAAPPPTPAPAATCYIIIGD
jgi:hypothetical protein